MGKGPGTTWENWPPECYSVCRHLSHLQKMLNVFLPFKWYLEFHQLEIPLLQ